MSSFPRICLLFAWVLLFGYGQGVFQQTQDITLCSWDSANSLCKTSEEVKLYLYTNSFKEQQATGASQCIVQDNVEDCNALSGCIYEENLDLNYSYVLDEPDQSLCVVLLETRIVSFGDYNYFTNIATNITNITDSFQDAQNANKECFEAGSFLYTIFDCQSRDFCSGVCGEVDPLFPDTCAVDYYSFPESQFSYILTSSMLLADALVNKDLATLTALIKADISPDASYYCTSVVPDTLPCLLIGGLDNQDCNFLVNPGKYYWESDLDINMFEDSLKCKEKTFASCEVQKVVVNQNP